MVRAAVVAVVLACACAGRGATPARALAGDELTLYRDRAIVRQGIDVEVPASGTATLTVEVAAGTRAEDIVIVERGGLELALSAPADARPPIVAGDGIFDPSTGADLEIEEPAPDIEPALEEAIDTDDVDEAPPGAPVAVPITLVARGTPGHHAVQLAYATEKLPWDVAYTMTTTPARDRVTLRGAVMITNSSGVAFRRARVHVVDADLGPWRARIAEQLAATLVGRTASTTPIASPRALGTLALGTGETRVEVLAGEPARKMRSVLVYDPIGTELDHPGSAPVRDPNLGVGERATSRVTESFEITRELETTEGLPGGPVRLLERRPDGALALLGESRLFDAAARVAEEDTVAIGVAQGVTGHRERRELTIDDEGKRLVEEFVLTLTNTRSHPVEVVLREHLYRGQNWTLAYQTGSSPKKEGPQQISLRTTVPAGGTSRVLYVVVYTWP